MILTGHVFDILPTLPSDSVQCIVTSPPYWGLRDYGVAGQLGLEPTFAEYLANQVAVFRECLRILKPDGTLWMNMGDSYARNGGVGKAGTNAQVTNTKTNIQRRNCKVPTGWKEKELIGQPWRLAFALQESGWYLRQDIIWAKPNALPESVQDRCTKSHEYLFLLTKKARYYYNAEAIKEPVTGTAHARGSGVNPKAGYKTPTGWDTTPGSHGTIHKAGRTTEARQNSRFSAAVRGLVETRNKRSVWNIPSKAYKGAHFATFPPALVLPCILAGSRPGDTVLDPYGGSGTVGAVAKEHGREFILIELNAEYVALAQARLAAPKIAPRSRRQPTSPIESQPTLFSLADF